MVDLEAPEFKESGFTKYQLAVYFYSSFKYRIRHMFLNSVDNSKPIAYTEDYLSRTNVKIKKAYNLTFGYNVKYDIYDKTLVLGITHVCLYEKDGTYAKKILPFSTWLLG